MRPVRSLLSFELYAGCFLLDFSLSLVVDLLDLNGFLHLENALSANELATAQAAVTEALAAGKRGQAWCWNKAMEVSSLP